MQKQKKEKPSAFWVPAETHNSVKAYVSANGGKLGYYVTSLVTQAMNLAELGVDPVHALLDRFVEEKQKEKR
jgi:hypothetical protein